MRIVGVMLALALCGLFALPALAGAPPPGTTKAEEELGKKTAERIEKDYKLVQDEEALKRLADIVTAIAPVTQRPQVVYTVKILDTGELNAMVIPGGIIYVTKGLLKAVESDDELAGVLAHEIAHNALCHAEKMMAREAKASLVQLATVIATVYAAQNSDIGTGEVLTMSELVKRSLLNGYNVEMEIEADEQGVAYLHKLKQYNPLGLYSVILGFEQMERHSPQINMGYMKTHPYSDERKELLKKQLAKLNIPINLWQVVGFRAKVTEPAEGEKGYTVRLGAVDLLTLTEPDGDRDAKTRANDAAAAINRRLMRDYIQLYDVEVAKIDGNTMLRMRRIPVITLTEADAKAAGLSLDALANLTMQRARSAIWQEVVKREG
ncbi:MAG: M48 family metalloprotease [Armatimonadota bacterium]